MSEKSSNPSRQVAHLRPGERFMWAGHVVRLLRAEGHDATRKGGKRRWLVVDAGEFGEKRLSYYDIERVKVVADG